MILVKRLWVHNGSIADVIRGNRKHIRYGSIAQQEEETFLKPVAATASLNGSSTSSIIAHIPERQSVDSTTSTPGLNVRETAWLSLEFCILWVIMAKSSLQQIGTVC